MGNRFTEGSELSARMLNAIAFAADGSPNPGMHRFAGQNVLALPWQGWIKITSAGTSGVYDYVELVPASSGSLVGGSKNGAKAAGTGAREINANNSVPLNSIARAWQAVFEVHFQLESC